VIYLDTSALIKLLRPEAETKALESYLDTHDRHPQVASELVVTEINRSLTRLSAPQDQFDTASELLARIVLLPVNRQTLDYAAALPGQHLRSLDAIHLASALRLRSALTMVITYDKRMTAAAQDAGVPITAPA
jgi:uncharacterized protein